MTAIPNRDHQHGGVEAVGQLSPGHREALAMTAHKIDGLRDGSLSRDRAICDLLQLEELGYAPGSVTVTDLRELWAASQSQVSRRMAAVHQLGVYWIRPGWGRYKIYSGHE